MTTTGTLLVYAAFASSIAAATTLAYCVVIGRGARIGRWSSGASVGFLALAVGYLGYQFVVTDYSNGYVWAHTADYLTVWYRLAGVFAGVEGGLLLWTTLVAVAGFRVVSTTVSERRTRAVGAVAAAVVAYFVLLVVAHSPFFPLDLSVASRITGPRGLNPLLLNPYMGIHPPITFVGYALTLYPFSLGVVHLARRARDEPGVFWARVDGATTWLRGAWIFLTASITLGALWSYYTLGWGGLWAWDPVQTASLVAWLFVTASLHALANRRQHGTMPVLSVSLATLSLPAVVFVRVVTQSGVFTSVHSFGVEFDPLLLVLFLATAVSALGLSLLRWRQSHSDESDEHPTTLLSYAVVLVLALAGLYTWGVLFPVGYAQVTNRNASFGVDFFNLWSYPLVVAVLFVLGYFNDRTRRGEDAARLLGTVALVTVVAALIPLPAWRFDPAASGLAYRLLGQVSTLSLVPPAVYAAGSGLARLVHRTRTQVGTDRLPALGTFLVHVGLVVLVLSVPFSYVGGSGAVVGPVLVDDQESLGDADGYSMVVHEVTETTRSSAVSFTESERELLREQVEDVGYAADEVPPTATGNVVVWGEVAAVEDTPDGVVYRLQDSDVWVVVDETESDASAPAFRVGEVFYAQGSIRAGESGGRVVETDERFVGRDPVQAIVLDRRSVDTRAELTVYRDGTRLARGWVGVSSSSAGGGVDVLVRPHALADTYVVPQQIARWNDSYLVTVSVKRVPWMNGVRLGVGFLLLGGVFRLWHPASAEDESTG